MSARSHSPELLALAERIIWFKPPEAALEDRVRFLAYLMTYGTWDDITVARRHFTEADFRDTLDKAPPGIIDPRSWAYWNLRDRRALPAAVNAAAVIP